MKKVFKITFITFTLLILFSCAGNKIISVVTNDYLGKSLEAEKLVVRSFLNEIEIRESGINPYQDKSELDLQNALSESIKLSSTFNNAVLENIDISSFEKKTLELSNNQIDISVPTTSLKIDESDFILFIEDYEIYHMINFTNNLVYTYHEFEYMVWDNKNNNIISYGVLDFSSTEFYHTVSTIVKLIFENSPFKIDQI